MLTTVLLVLHASRCVLGLSFGNQHSRYELTSLPGGYAPHHIAPHLDQGIRLTIAMPQVNESGLYKALLDISDPTSRKYGRHLSTTEVAQYTAPRPDSLTAVTQWLNANGIAYESATHSGDILQMQMTLERANTLLDANFTTYIHGPTNTTTIRTLSYVLPVDLHDHITLVHPTTQFLPPMRSRQGAPIDRLTTRETDPPTSCEQAITPSCLQSMYSIPSSPATATSNSLYISGFGVEIANMEDLKGYLSEFRADIEDPNFQVLSTDGSPNDGAGTFEANSDSQITVGLATGVPITYLKAGNAADGVTTDDLWSELQFLLQQDRLPSVLTTSYVFQESEDLVSFASSVCNAYARLGAMGTSVIFAAGDCGVAGGFLQSPVDCVDKPFVATFPSTCPYVTSVGATQGMEPEVAWSSSSGGFSNIFQRPSYQDAAVARYLEGLGSTYAGRYNASGRAFPDVSAYGVNYLVNLAGSYMSALGTSMAAPTFASIIVLLNDRLLTAGRPKLGFLNPLLYSPAGAAAFTDITSGNNPGCATDGFPADVGWDPVTGLGTPDFDKLLDTVSGGVVQTTQNVENAALRTSIAVSLHVAMWTLVTILCSNINIMV